MVVGEILVVVVVVVVFFFVGVVSKSVSYEQDAVFSCVFHLGCITMGEVRLRPLVGRTDRHDETSNLGLHRALRTLNTL